MRVGTRAEELKQEEAEDAVVARKKGKRKGKGAAEAEAAIPAMKLPSENCKKGRNRTGVPKVPGSFPLSHYLTPSYGGSYGG